MSWVIYPTPLFNSGYGHPFPFKDSCLTACSARCLLVNVWCIKLGCSRWILDLWNQGTETTCGFKSLNDLWLLDVLICDLLLVPWDDLMTKKTKQRGIGSINGSSSFLQDYRLPQKTGWKPSYSLVKCGWVLGDSISWTPPRVFCCWVD